MALQVRKVAKDELPKANMPGRTRQSSDFDELIDEAYADGEWREVVYDGTLENFNYLLAELNRAVIHVGNLDGRDGKYGKSIRGAISKDDETGEVTEPVRNPDGDAVFFFLIRDKLRTGPRGPRKTGQVDADGNEVELDEGDEPSGVSYGVDGEEVEELADSITEAKSSKRGRKSSVLPW
jgi:hypothetical protein